MRVGIAPILKMKSTYNYTLFIIIPQVFFVVVYPGPYNPESALIIS